MLTAFTAGLLLITVSELGDKTFFIAMLLAMRYRRRYVLAGVIAALAAMTLLSVILGKTLSLVPEVLIHHLAIALFVGFGLKLLWDAWRMGNRGCEDAVEDAEQSLQGVCLQATARAIVLESFSLTFVAEWGDRTQFSTVLLAGSNNTLGVTLGAILGHSICALIAVLGGRFLAGRLSERLITGVGGIMFVGCGLLMVGH